MYQSFSLQKSRIILVGIFLSLNCCLSFGFEARVVGITDGDTLTVIDGSYQQHKIRIAGIDAPEKKQPFGQKSKSNLSDLVFNRSVEIVGDKTDRYGRKVSKVIVMDLSCPDKKCSRHVDVGLQQVREGLAWWYRKYQKEQSIEDRFKYEQAEIMARRLKLGIWADPAPTAPWDWRHR